jgi:hypothetical protein
LDISHLLLIAAVVLLTSVLTNAIIDRLPEILAAFGLPH